MIQTSTPHKCESHADVISRFSADNAHNCPYCPSTQSNPSFVPGSHGNILATSSVANKSNFAASLGAAAIAAGINFPLWRASAMAHSGFTPAPLSPFWSSRIAMLPEGLRSSATLYKHAMTGPFPGAAAVVGGMTWARASIFYGSDALKAGFLEAGVTNPIVINVVPSFTVSTFVQVVNTPLIRSTITQQDPEFRKIVYGPKSTKTPSTIAALKHIYETGGVRALWHGTTAGLLKTVPKYMVSIFVKDLVSARQKEQNQGKELTQTDVRLQSATKSVVAAVAGACLTNPMDVIRNEIFKDNSATLVSTLKKLCKNGDMTWMAKGLRPNLLAVSAPIGTTIFLTDLFTENMGNGVQLSRRITRSLNNTR